MTDPQEIRQEEVADEAASSNLQPAPEHVETAEAADAGTTEADTDTDTDTDTDERSREELLVALGEAERARDEYVDYLRRERAEFENYRKRASRERLEAVDRGAELLVTGLLGVLDHFELALDAAERSEDEGLAKGVQMVHAELLTVLQNAGLEEIPGEGVPFDPNEHEAMMQVDASEELGEEIEEAVVVEVLRRGYRFKGRVVRPASVKVAR